VVCVLVTWLVYGRRKPAKNNGIFIGWRLTPYPARRTVFWPDIIGAGEMS
jgi:hypothetical protein